MTDLTYYHLQKYFNSCQESMSFTMCFFNRNVCFEAAYDS